MNPYDFARIDWDRPPERRKPIWHHRLSGEQPLYSGHMDVNIYAETPLFVSDPRNVSRDPRRPTQSMQNKQGDYIIPGSSLKGMLRGVVEALGNGCLTLFDGNYKKERVNYNEQVLPAFQHCSTNTDLCIACRSFGMLKERAGGVFLGKVNIGDARTDPDKVYKYDPMYTAILVEPKPHHQAFYLDDKERYIAGRKFYFHHSADMKPETASGPKSMGGKPANRYIQPLDYDTQFTFRVDFTNLEADEFGALILAAILEKEMRHKIGYGKPLGLGTVYLVPIHLTLIDYSTRYTQPGSGKRELTGNAMWDVLYEHSNNFIRENHLQTLAMDDLRRIWRWPPESGVEYYYPSKRDWFDTPDSRGKRIADTRNVP